MKYSYVVNASRISIKGMKYLWELSKAYDSENNCNRINAYAAETFAKILCCIPRTRPMNQNDIV